MNRRYDTARYPGAAGLDWSARDPSLRLLMRRYLGPEGLAFAEPHLARLGALIGGPVARWAEQTDRDPPRLERYDRWGHEVSRVVAPASFDAARRELLAASVTTPEFTAKAAAAGADPRALEAAWMYLLSQADIGMLCALGTGGDMVARLAEAHAPPDVRDRVRRLSPPAGTPVRRRSC